MMGRRWGQLSTLLGLSWITFWVPSVHALPGESVETVAAWIAAHPTLRPRPTEILVVNRFETPARRFTFRATIFPITGLIPGTSLQRVIRTEQITLVDTVDGTSANRLEESLRVIYDANLYSDYQLAEVVYRYPNSFSPFPTNEAILRLGELRLGDRYGYWLELTSNQSGFVYSGTLSVVALEDVPRLKARLQGTE
jgi:hypothetical protein